MRKINLDGNLTIFLLFFGISMLEAIQTGNWIKSIFWLAIGIVFLKSGDLKKSDAGN
jgi:hypothetical protein